MSTSALVTGRRHTSHWTIARHVVSLSPLVVAGILTLLFHYMAPRFTNWSNIANVGSQAAPLFIATIGQVFVMTVGGLDISVGGVAAFSSMVMAWAAVNMHSGIGIVVGLLAGTALGATNGWVVTRFRINSIIVTIAMLSIAQGLAFLMGGGQPITGIPPSMQWFGWGSLAGIPAAVVLGLGALVLGHIFISQTDVGVNLRAVGEGYDTARLVGLHHRGLVLFAFSVSGFTAALASVIWTANAGGGNPLVGSGLALQTIAAAVIGGVTLGRGTGSLLGAVGGALVITILSVGMNLAGVAPYNEQIALGVALIFTLLFNRWQHRLQILVQGLLSGRVNR